MLPILMNTILSVSKRINLQTRIVSAKFHSINGPNNLNIINQARCTFLQPVSPCIVPSCEFKVVGKVARRCKDCFVVAREQRLYVLCKTHPRHKQMSMIKSPRNTWILSHATQSKVRPW